MATEDISGSLMLPYLGITLASFPLADFTYR